MRTLSVAHTKHFACATELYIVLTSDVSIQAQQLNQILRIGWVGGLDGDGLGRGRRARVCWCPGF